MKQKLIAKQAREIFDEYEHKSTEWCIQYTADLCDVGYSDVVDAITSNPKISGFQQTK